MGDVTMERERYPGERRGLGLFLAEMQPIVERTLGHDALLFHGIRRALRHGSLAELRRARRLVNHQPEAIRRTLYDGLVHRGTAPGKDELMERYGSREPEPMVAFDSIPGTGEETSVRLRHELVDVAEVTVLVRPGTLPNTVARTLRGIADRVERDRRLLSANHWDVAPDKTTAIGKGEQA
jgi:hypothetical protein